MKKARLILSASLLTIAAFTSVTMVSCSKDDDCEVGYTGNNCKTEVRASYYNTYRGTATDNQGGTYTDWALRFSSGGTDATKLKLEVLNNVNANVFLFDAVLTSNSSYEIVGKTIDGFDYVGNGSISDNNASLTLTETDPTGVEVTYVYTFNNFVKE